MTRSQDFPSQTGYPSQSPEPSEETAIQPELHPILQAGGLISAIGARAEAASGYEEDRVHAKLAVSYECDRLRCEYRNQRFKNDDFTITPEVRLESTLCYPQERKNSGFLLRYCLGHRFKMKNVCDRWFQDAAREYMEHPNAFEEILGDLIPDQFRETIRRHEAKQTFLYGNHVTAAEDWSVYRAWRENRRQQPLQGISTGLPSCDRALNGLQAITLLGGATGIGKTSLALNFALGALQKHSDLAVLFLSLDLHKAAILDKLFSLDSGVSYRDLCSSSQSDATKEKLLRAEERLKQETLPRLGLAAPLTERGTGSRKRMKAGDILKLRYELLEATGMQRALIVVDHLQKLESGKEGGHPLEMDQARFQLLEEVQQCTRNPNNPTGDPLLVVAEIRKEAGSRGLKPADLLGSVDLAYSAQAVLFLEPANDDATPGSGVEQVILRIAKGRDGVVRGATPLLFEHTCSRFREPEISDREAAHPTQTVSTSDNKPSAQLLNPLGGSNERT